jgi:hypothetical protein
MASGRLRLQQLDFFLDQLRSLCAPLERSEATGRMCGGGIRQVLNSYLQFLELDSSASLELAATNHGALLDRGLFCRFDSVLFRANPAAAIATKVIMARGSFLDCSAMNWQEAAAHGSGPSHPELVLAHEQATKLSWRIAPCCASGIWRKRWSGCVLDPCGIEIKALAHASNPVQPD